MHGQHQRHAAQAADVAEILARVIAQARIHGGVEGQRARVGRAQRVAIGRGACDQRGADDAGRAGTVVHDHGLAQVLAHLHGQLARDHVCGAARCVGHHPFDGLGGPGWRTLGGRGWGGLRLGGAHAQRQQGAGKPGLAVQGHWVEQHFCLRWFYGCLLRRASARPQHPFMRGVVAKGPAPLGPGHGVEVVEVVAVRGHAGW